MKKSNEYLKNYSKLFNISSTSVYLYRNYKINKKYQITFEKSLSYKYQYIGAIFLNLDYEILI